MSLPVSGRAHNGRAHKRPSNGCFSECFLEHTKGPQRDPFQRVRAPAKVPSAKDLCKTAPTSACLLPSVEVTQKAAKRMIFRVFSNGRSNYQAHKRSSNRCFSGGQDSRQGAKRQGSVQDRSNFGLPPSLGLSTAMLYYSSFYLFFIEKVWNILNRD